MSESQTEVVISAKDETGFPVADLPAADAAEPAVVDKPIPLYQKLLALGCLLLVAAFIIFWWSRFKADFYPIDHSNVGPNLVASVVQFAVILIVAALLWPPTRRRIHAFADRKLNTVHDKLDSIHQHHLTHHDDFAALHAKMDEALRQNAHIIKHSKDIPDEIPADE